MTTEEPPAQSQGGEAPSDAAAGGGEASSARGTIGFPAVKELVVGKYTRSPIVAVLGHVDHGKTSLLDKIRGTTVADREAGAITQHIGASELPIDHIHTICRPLLGEKRFKVPGLLFIDTPGHQAFTSLRSRGGALADLAVLVVDVTEGFMPQTVEALNILKRFKTPFVVAANKIDRVPRWKSEDRPFRLNLADQSAEAISNLDMKIYELVERLGEHKFPSDRYDRVSDYTKSIAIVPACARTGEGIPDLLMVLVGLAQRFLERRLETSETGPGVATILEVKEEKGLGVTLDTILYQGLVKVGDEIALGTRGDPVVTKVKAILRPKPLDEIRDPRDTFARVAEVHAAAGVKLIAQHTEGVVAGAPLRVLREPSKRNIIEEVRESGKLNVPLEDEGILVKGDTLGALEALAFEAQQKKIPIRGAAVGDVSRRDVVEAATAPNTLNRVILAFNVNVLPDARTEQQTTGTTILEGDIIYRLIEDYEAWLVKAKEALDRAQREQLVHPGMIKYLEGNSFRVSHPAVFGVRVLAGRLTSGQKLIREDGREVGSVKSIQKEKKTVAEAHMGDEVAVAMEGVTLGRQISEGDILLIDVPESHAKKLNEMKKLLMEEQDVLNRLFGIKRATDRFWGM